MTSPARYTRTAILLHWLIAVLIIVNLALPTVWEEFVSEARAGAIVDLHKSIGITVLGLVLMRILWRIGHRPPAYPARYARWEARLSNAVHGLLYLLMLGVPLVGYVMESASKWAKTAMLPLFGAIPFPRLAFVMEMDAASRHALHELLEELHEIGGYVLAALVVLHVVGALKHQFVDREAEMQRMLP